MSWTRAHVELELLDHFLLKTYGVANYPSFRKFVSSERVQKNLAVVTLLERFRNDTPADGFDERVVHYERIIRIWYLSDDRGELVLGRPYGFVEGEGSPTDLSKETDFERQSRRLSRLEELGGVLEHDKNGNIRIRPNGPSALGDLVQEEKQKTARRASSRLVSEDVKVAWQRRSRDTPSPSHTLLSRWGSPPKEP